MSVCSISVPIAQPFDNCFESQGGPPDDLAASYDLGFSVGTTGSSVCVGDLRAAGRGDQADALLAGLRAGWVDRVRLLAFEAGKTGQGAAVVRDTILKSCPALDWCVPAALAAWSTGNREYDVEQVLRSDWLRDAHAEDEQQHTEREAFLARGWSTDYCESIEYGGDQARLTR